MSIYTVTIAFELHMLF